MTTRVSATNQPLSGNLSFNRLDFAQSIWSPTYQSTGHAITSSNYLSALKGLTLHSVTSNGVQHQLVFSSPFNDGTFRGFFADSNDFEQMRKGICAGVHVMTGEATQRCGWSLLDLY